MKLILSITEPNDEPDLIYQVLKQATDLKKPGFGGSSSGSGSANGFHGSSQTLSQQDFRGSASALPSSVANRRSNPTFNVEGNQSGTASPALAAPPALHPSSSGKEGAFSHSPLYLVGTMQISIYNVSPMHNK